LEEIDDRLTSLVRTALGSPLAPLATRALARIEAAGKGAADVDDPFAPFGGETGDGRALRQLKVLDAIVGGTLALELDLFDRSLELARKVDGGLSRGEHGPERFATVMLVDPDEDAAPDAERSPLAGDNLLSGRRRESLQRTQDAWRAAVGEVASTILGDPEGDIGDR